MSVFSLRSRIVVVAVSATVLGCGALVALGFRLNAAEIETAVHGRARAIADGLARSEITSSANGMRQALDELYRNKSFVAAAVFSPSRELVAASPSSAAVSPIMSVWPDVDAGIRDLEIDGVRAVAVSAVIADGGRVWLAFDRSPYGEAHARLRLTWALIGLFATVTALVASSMIGNSAARRLRDLQQTVERLGEGQLDVRSPVGGPEEIENLGSAVNRMAENFQARAAQLEEDRTALEQQVSGRTRELEQANRLLMDIANRDALTGLANRRRLEMELERNISFSQRTGQPLAVIMMDLDKFKICNDTAGHLVGDNVLRAVASTLRSRVRVTDLVVRWGGDEFCILVPATQPEGAVAAAESLVEAVAEATSSVTLPDGLDPPTASAGVACFPEDGEDSHTLILNADAALYQVKATGRGRVLRYSARFSKG